MHLDLPTKSSVRKAGKRIVAAGSLDAASAEDIAVIDSWRKSHLKPLTAISMWLRAPSQESTGLSPAQRLKRLNTVLDKIISGRAKDPSSMQDLGGCRLIFQDLSQIQDFRRYMEKESRKRHDLLHDPKKYDYIANAKATGYRGVHYVYGYRPSSPLNAELDGLKIEVQLRTNVQHAWATAVEIADLVFGARTKFEDGTGEYGEFFRLSSEILARHHEGQLGCLAEISNAELKERFEESEEKHQVLDRLDKLKEQGDLEKIKEHTVLAFRSDDKLEIYGYKKAARAVEKEQELIYDPSCLHVVYVSASTPAAIRNSYRNYLTNPADFVKLMRSGLAAL